jgi:hypothetical protein
MVMAWITWAGSLLLLCLVTGIAFALAVAVMGYLWFKRKRRAGGTGSTGQTGSWGDSFDNWYPDYPFTDSKAKGEKTIRQEPDKHEEEE